MKHSGIAELDCVLDDDAWRPAWRPAGDQPGDPAAPQSSKRTLVEMWGVQGIKQRSSWRATPMKEAQDRAEELERMREEVIAEKQALKELKRRCVKKREKKDWRDCRSASRNPLVKANRLQAGMQRRRWDCNPHDGLTICRKYEEMMQKGAPDQREVLLTLKRSWDRRPELLKRIAEKGLAFWKKKCREDMKTGAGTKGTLNKRGQSLKKHMFWEGQSKGCRAPGGGAKNRFAAHISALKTWIDVELENQNAVTPEDAACHFEWMLQMDIAALKNIQEPSHEQTCRLHEVEDRVKHLQDTNYRKYQKT